METEIIDIMQPRSRASIASVKLFVKYSVSPTMLGAMIVPICDIAFA